MTRAADPAPRCVLVAGLDDGEIVELARRADAVLGHGTAFFALEVAAGSTDASLAWGTARPVVRQLELGPDGGAAGGVATPLPLGPDGDTAPAILDAARHVDADIIVTAVHARTWVMRLFARSAATDLLESSEVPVLMVNLQGSGPV